MKAKRIKDKKPHQLKLASMSLNYGGGSTKKSSKHRSQEVQRWKKLSRKRATSSSSKKYKA